MNSSWGGDHLVRPARINVGCAVAREDGLIVPVIQDADHTSVSVIAAEVASLIWVGVADGYVRLAASGTIHDPRFF